MSNPEVFCYAKGGQLNERQLVYLKAEGSEAGNTVAQLVKKLNHQFAHEA